MDVLLAALNVTVKFSVEPSVTTGVPEMLSVALSLSLIVPVEELVVDNVILASPVIAPSVTITVSLASTRVSLVVGTLIVAVVLPAGIVTLVVVSVKSFTTPGMAVPPKL